MHIAEWVRQALERARRHERLGDVRRKLEVIRIAARNKFPTADIGDMLAEIEAGYLPKYKPCGFDGFPGITRLS